jgi:hypothetical protein
MIKEALLFAGTFAVCAALSSSMTACQGDDCECASTPDRPPTVGETPATIVSRESDAAPSFQPKGAHLESTGATVVVHYVETGVSYQAVYVVEGPAWP